MTASDLLDELHAFFMGLLAGHEELQSAAIIEFDKSRAALGGAAAQADTAPGRAVSEERLRDLIRPLVVDDFDPDASYEMRRGWEAAIGTVLRALAAPSRDAGLDVERQIDELAAAMDRHHFGASANDKPFCSCGWAGEPSDNWVTAERQFNQHMATRVVIDASGPKPAGTPGRGRSA